MNIIELLIDEAAELMGIEAISLVENPAIEENWVAFAGDQVNFAKQDEEKHILMGAALIPNKPIYRRDGENEYYVYFSKETIRRASELFFQRGNQGEATLEHEKAIQGLTVVESWIIEGEQDKSRMYGLDMPVGTWMVSMKVENQEIWDKFVKTGKVKGFSIEGYFVDKVNMSEMREESAAQEILDMLAKEM
tara:strand:+ start:421 stop:996 length:576 start_codon:yes stop_codon:yes gene_type:complete